MRRHQSGSRQRWPSLLSKVSLYGGARVVPNIIFHPLPLEQWNTRSRKRKNPFDEGHSVESTDTEDDLTSQNTFAVSLHRG